MIDIIQTVAIIVIMYLMIYIYFVMQSERIYKPKSLTNIVDQIRNNTDESMITITDSGYDAELATEIQEVINEQLKLAQDTESARIRSMKLL